MGVCHHDPSEVTCAVCEGGLAEVACLEVGIDKVCPFAQHDVVAVVVARPAERGSVGCDAVFINGEVGGCWAVFQSGEANQIAFLAITVIAAVAFHFSEIRGIGTQVVDGDGIGVGRVFAPR